MCLRFYKNGMVIEDGKLRPYNDPNTVSFIRDILDGYFPSELQKSYPNGVPFKVSKTHQFWMNRKIDCTWQFISIVFGWRQLRRLKITGQRLICWVLWAFQDMVIVWESKAWWENDLLRRLSNRLPRRMSIHPNRLIFQLTVKRNIVTLAKQDLRVPGMTIIFQMCLFIFL